VLALAARLSSPRIDPMLDAPRPVERLPETANRNIPASPLPVATKPRRSIANMLAR
jgi:hypothetical protein